MTKPTAILLCVSAALAQDATGILKKSRAAYAALKSYSDTGEIRTEEQSPGAAPVVEKHRFRTHYRAPRQFLLEFKEDEAGGGDRFVIWCEGEDFFTWWSASQAKETYPKGQGATAFALATLPTKGSAMLTAPLIFHQAGLRGPLATLETGKLVGTEDVGGKACYRITGEAHSAYSTGGGATARPTTVWIDRESLLVRKIAEDTPSTAPGGSVDRVVTTLEPMANPAVTDADFRFQVPK